MTEPNDADGEGEQADEITIPEGEEVGVCENHGFVTGDQLETHPDEPAIPTCGECGEHLEQVNVMNEPLTLPADELTGRPAATDGGQSEKWPVTVHVTVSDGDVSTDVNGNVPLWVLKDHPEGDLLESAGELAERELETDGDVNVKIARSGDLTVEDPTPMTDGGTPNATIQSVTIAGPYEVEVDTGERVYGIGFYSENQKSDSEGDALIHAEDRSRGDILDELHGLDDIPPTVYESARFLWERNSPEHTDPADDGERGDGERGSDLPTALTAVQKSARLELSDELMNLARHLYDGHTNLARKVKDSERGHGSQLTSAVYQARSDALLDAAQLARETSRWLEGERARPPALHHGEQLKDEGQRIPHDTGNTGGN